MMGLLRLKLQVNFRLPRSADGSEAINPVRYKACCYFAAVAMNSISTCAPPGSAAMPMVLRAG